MHNAFMLQCTQVTWHVLSPRRVKAFPPMSNFLKKIGGNFKLFMQTPNICILHYANLYCAIKPLHSPSFLWSNQLLLFLSLVPIYIHVPLTSVLYYLQSVKVTIKTVKLNSNLIQTEYGWLRLTAFLKVFSFIDSFIIDILLLYLVRKKSLLWVPIISSIIWARSETC